MLKKIGFVVLIALATLGVLFIILMLLPGDDDEETQEADAIIEEQEDAEVMTQLADLFKETEEETEEEEPVEEEEPDEESEEVTNESASASGSNGTVPVHIPESELSKGQLVFRTTSLDGQVITEDIFSEADITVVWIWGTYCGPCIAEMPDYAKFYQALPDNINLVGLLVDVYDGIDTNVSEAWEILSDAGAEFLNLRTSDDLYDIVDNINYTPSALLVDSEGHIIGGIMDGAGYSDMIKQLSNYVEIE